MLLSNNFLFIWKLREKTKRWQSLLPRSHSHVLKAGQLPTCVYCLHFQIWVSSGKAVHSENWILFIPKLMEFFPIQLPCLWFVPVLILFIREKKNSPVVFKCPSITSSGTCTTHTAAVQQPSWPGQLLWPSVVFPLADFTMYFLLQLHEI